MRKLIDTMMRWGWRLLALIALGLVLLLAANAWLVGMTAKRVVEPLDGCPEQFDVALVFGTSQLLRSGRPNPHYYGRIDLAAELYHQGRVRHLLLSGDNRTRYYNEPNRMQRDLLERGVAIEDMTLDYAGFSTFDSLKRSRDVFEQERLLLITQAYHLPRALFIANYLGLDAWGCAATGPEWHAMRKLWLRELAARLRTLGDLYLWKREPRILGDPEPIAF